MRRSPTYKKFPPQGVLHGLAPKPAKDDSEKEVEEVLSQHKRPERGRYLLQVDRQTKGSYTTLEAAQSAAAAIKTGYPIVQVSVYDSVDYTHTMVEVAAASS